MSSVPVAPGEYVPTADNRVVMHGVPWSHYETQLALRGEKASPRITFLDGVLELMSPSKDHERIKSYIGCLVEAFAFERNSDLSPYGSWTLKSAPKSAGLEPDECYLVGSDQKRDTPDLVIQVVWTSGGVDKLEGYRRLGVPEVWYWKKDAIVIHLLRGDRYEESAKSGAFPEMDLELLVSFLDQPTVTQAVRAYRKALG